MMAMPKTIYYLTIIYKLKKQFINIIVKQIMNFITSTFTAAFTSNINGQNK